VSSVNDGSCVAHFTGDGEAFEFLCAQLAKPSQHPSRENIGSFAYLGALDSYPSPRASCRALQHLQDMQLPSSLSHLRLDFPLAKLKDLPSTAGWVFPSVMLSPALLNSAQGDVSFA